MKNSIHMTQIGWTTVIDLSNKLIIHMAINARSVEIDNIKSDPDGIPLVWVDGNAVTRVRRMTDEEFAKYASEYGLNLEIDMRVVHVKSKDTPKI